MKIDMHIEGVPQLAARLKNWPPTMRRNMRTALIAVGNAWVMGAKRRVPVDTGLLRNSINKAVEVTPRYFELAVGSNVRYACVFGASTRVVVLGVAGGLKRIADVVVGDMVMTQSGDYRKVLATPRFAARDKPDLVTITVPWRAGHDHELTLTADHKVLVHRDGRNQWVEAGTIAASDRVHVRRKIAHNKTDDDPPRPCKLCETPFVPSKEQSRAQRERQQYCSSDCYHRAPSAHVGMKRSARSRKRMSDAAKQKLADCPELHPSRLVAQRGFVTACERTLYAWLDERRVSFERQYPVGRHVVDAFSDEQRTIYEADGAYWHRDQAVDIARDAELQTDMPGVRIVHLHFFDKRFSPAIVNDPLPGVQYVCCNPGPKSYCDLSAFDLRPVSAVRRWNYLESCTDPKDARKAKLYDLTVEGEHSFVAAGVVISNSFIEFGTEHIAGGRVKSLGTGPVILDSEAITTWPALVARGGSNQQMPFLRPAFQEIKVAAIKKMNDALAPPPK